MTEIDVAYLASLKDDFPHLRIVQKEGDGFSRLLDRALRALTFGGQKAFLTRYVTTIGQTLYVPTTWSGRSPESRYIVLRHEAVHLRQFRRYGFLLTAFLYLVPILPLGLAYGRARLEWEAYAESIRATWEVYGREAAHKDSFHDFLVKQFTTSAYGWMWPFPKQVRGWIDKELERLEAEGLPGQSPTENSV